MITNFKVGDICVSDKGYQCPIIILSMGLNDIGKEKYYWGGFDGLRPFSNFGHIGLTKAEMLNELNNYKYHYCGNVNEKINKTLIFYKEEHFKKINNPA